ncbi:PerC family transcriptional regulator [Citrobacter youngae]|uniref:Transcriptional activator PerC n=1 Tax=Citrobacter youngae ATCC 29220 TaxID=500640 RepID=D4BAW8_9ENTR|nr:PerC family transcriptional regulator [Citrobacter youngae]EFE09329.1 transcriptional activator PerC [Citrobacter youngae ATCC 29220]
MIQDHIAEKLEAAGLWRRAATRWLNVMLRIEYTVAEREWIRQRRIYCQSKITPVAVPEPLNFSDIARAASTTQARMGINKPRGITLRLQTEPPAEK